MAKFRRDGSTLIVSGALSADELDSLLRQGHALLDDPSPKILLDLSAANPDDSSFVGAVAQLATDTRSRSKTLTVRASGRAGDLLVWAGLHRVVTLHVEPSPVSAG
jgi:ABC-type transporter Mla MlaB component